jgi:hypothetical protein
MHFAHFSLLKESFAEMFFAEWKPYHSERTKSIFLKKYKKQRSFCRNWLEALKKVLGKIWTVKFWCRLFPSFQHWKPQILFFDEKLFREYWIFCYFEMNSKCLIYFEEKKNVTFLFSYIFHAVNCISSLT